MKRIFSLFGCLMLCVFMAGNFVGCESETQGKTTVLTEISIVNPPAKTDYIENEGFNPDGLVVNAKYSDGFVKIITEYETDFSEVVKTEGNNKKVTVTYTEGAAVKTAVFNINVYKADSVVSIMIKQLPLKTIYYTGDSFSTEGLVVEALRRDGTTETITDWIIDGETVVQEAGENKTVTVSYNGQTATFTINVEQLELDSISIIIEPTKLSYYTSDTFDTFDTFDTTGMVVTATYNNGTTKIVTGWTTDGDEVLKTAGKSRTVTVSYTEDGITRTATFTVEVFYNFHENVEKISSVTINNTSYDIVTFGDWPQTIKPEDVTVDKSDFITRGANTYYKGDDNNWYAEVSAKPYSTGSQYKFTDGTSISSGTTYYFKIEPIKWRVLTKNYNNTGKALLLAEKELAANIPYYEYNSSSNTRTVGSDTNIYPNNYEYSQVRAYLNGFDYYYDPSSTVTKKKTDYTEKGFLQTAFTQSAQSLIAVTEVDNSAESTTDATGYITKATEYACENTNDKIFLLSEKEVTTTAYGFEKYNYDQGSTRIRKPTDYALANYACLSPTSGCGGYWWLRSPYSRSSYSARYVDSYGCANDSYLVDNYYYGIVPALTISY